MKSGNLNFLEPSGPLQGCNGTALPLPLPLPLPIEVYLNIDNYECNRLCHHTALFRKIIYTLVQLKAVAASLDLLFDFISAFMFLL